MPEFLYEALPMRVRFRSGALADLADELDSLGLRRVLLLSTPDQRPEAERLAASLGGRAAGVHAGARMHVPTECVDEAEAEAERLGADGYVALGGGSTIGLGKALALRSAVPIIAVPTTFAGSEMTPVWGLTSGGVKETGRDPRVLPRSVVYDPELVRTLPVDLCVTSGFNAVAHAVEGLYAPDCSPVVELMAAEGARALLQALPRIVASPEESEPRADALYGAWLCGATLGATTMGLHHKLCHALGGALDLPHAQTHTVVLPYAAAFNLSAAPTALRRLRTAVSDPDPAQYLQGLARRLGAPRSLAELGMKEPDIDLVADLVVAKPYANPRPVTRDDVITLLRAAWKGETL